MLPFPRWGFKRHLDGSQNYVDDKSVIQKCQFESAWAPSGLRAVTGGRDVAGPPADCVP